MADAVLSIRHPCMLTSADGDAVQRTASESLYQSIGASDDPTVHNWIMMEMYFRIARVVTTRCLSYKWSPCWQP
jgi:hypothetical protein